MSNHDLEVKERFGETNTYKEYSKKTANYTKDKWQDINDGLMSIFSKFAQCINSGHTSGSNEAQAIVKELQDYITENYYTCTKEILANLGQMYVNDERFKNTIEKCAPDTANFISNAIKIYCNH